MFAIRLHRVAHRSRALLAGLAWSFALAAHAELPDLPVREEQVTVPGDDVALTGVLFSPVGVAGHDRRRPAIVLLHGCSGMLDGRDGRGPLAPRHRDWAERFARWGFVTLLVDSFNPRGYPRVCELKQRPLHPWNERTSDAYHALAWLAARSDVDAKSIFALGWSHGGSTVMGLVREHPPGLADHGPRFKAAIAFYPGCALPLRLKSYRPTMPLLILHGEADDWTPAAPCVRLGARLQSAGHPVRTIVYPDAHHGFDAPVGKVRLLPDVYNPARPNERGAHVGPHPQARTAAIGEVSRFVEKQLGR